MVQSVLAIARDITGLKNIEQELKQRTNFIERLALASPDIMYLMNFETKVVTYTNRSIAETLEYETTINTLFDLMHPDDMEPMLLHLEHLKDAVDGEVREIEYRLKHANGSWIWFKDRNAIFERNKDGMPLSKIGITENIDEKKRQEDLLIKHLNVLDQSEEIANLGSWEYDLASGNISWSKGMYNIFGITQGEKISLDAYLEYVKEEYRPIAEEMVSQIKKATDPVEEIIHIRRADNSERTLKIKGIAINAKGHPVKFVGVDMDITERLQSEALIRESKHLLEQTADVTPDAINIFNLTNKQPLYLNKKLASWLGYTNDELQNLGFEGRLHLIHSEDRDKLLEHNESVLRAADDEVKSLEYRLTSKTGKTIWICNRSKVFGRNDQGAVTHILSVLQNITEKKE